MRLVCRGASLVSHTACKRACIVPGLCAAVASHASLLYLTRMTGYLGS